MRTPTHRTRPSTRRAWSRGWATPLGSGTKASSRREHGAAGVSALPKRSCGGAACATAAYLAVLCSHRQTSVPPRQNLPSRPRDLARDLVVGCRQRAPSRAGSQESAVRASCRSSTSRRLVPPRGERDSASAPPERRRLRLGEGAATPARPRRRPRAIAPRGPAVELATRRAWRHGPARLEPAC